MPKGKTSKTKGVPLFTVGLSSHSEQKVLQLVTFLVITSVLQHLILGPAQGRQDHPREPAAQEPSGP